MVQVQLDALHIIVFGTAIALFYKMVQVLAAMLLGGPLEPVGRAILAIYPG